MGTIATGRKAWYEQKSATPPGTGAISTPQSALSFSRLRSAKGLRPDPL